MGQVLIKRIYEPFSETDGYRILVDRLWPRGIKKNDAHIDKWLKDVAPSTALRKWFDHDAEKWDDFRKKYLAELKNSDAFDELKSDLHKEETITLLYAVKDEKLTHALILQQLITQDQ